MRGYTILKSPEVKLTHQFAHRVQDHDFHATCQGNFLFRLFLARICTYREYIPMVLPSSKLIAWEISITLFSNIKGGMERALHSQSDATDFEPNLLTLQSLKAQG